MTALFVRAMLTLKVFPEIIKGALSIFFNKLPHVVRVIVSFSIFFHLNEVFCMDTVYVEVSLKVAKVLWVRITNNT